MAKETIVGYDVVETHNLEKLIDVINFRIKQGWEPIGGVAVSTSSNNHFKYHQAIIKKKHESN